MQCLKVYMKPHPPIENIFSNRKLVSMPSDLSLCIYHIKTHSPMHVSQVPRTLLLIGMLTSLLIQVTHS